MTHTLKFRHCLVHASPGYVETVFDDGTRVVAVPEEGAAYRALAARFGYGGDVRRLSREHEILHTFLAERLGFGSSPTLWAVAHGGEGLVAPRWEQEEEEAWTLAFQGYLNGGPAEPSLCRFTEAGLELEELRAEAREMLWRE